MQCRTLKLGRLIVLQETFLYMAIENSIPIGNSLFSIPGQPLDFNMLVIFSLKNVKQGHKLELHITYLIDMLAGSCIGSAVNKYQNGTAKVAKKASNMGRSGTQYVAMVTDRLSSY